MNMVLSITIRTGAINTLSHLCANVLMRSPKPQKIWEPIEIKKFVCQVIFLDHFKDNIFFSL